MLAYAFASVFALLVTFANCQGYSTDEPKLDDSKHDTQFFNFITRPDLDAPRWKITVYNESAVAPGLWFVAPYGTVSQAHNDKAYVAPHIYDSDGELIWSGATMFERFAAFTFKVSNVGGRDMLTALYPIKDGGWILTDEYEYHALVKTGEQGVTLNMHEFRIVDNGTRALYLKKNMLTSLANSEQVGYEGGPCLAVFHGIEEQDLETGEITFQWSSEDQITLDESVMYEHDPVELCEVHGKGEGDWQHANAAEKLPDGDYLFSARHTDTIYKISKNGEILWRLGGKKSDFDLDGHFSGQHDVRCLSQNSTHMVITLLDNAIGTGWPKKTNDNSRGLVLSVNEETMTAKAIMHYDHPNNGYARGKGSFQTLPNGNALMFWRDNALCSEYTPDGTLVKVAKLRPGVETYRGYKFEWVGRPKDPPDVHSELVAFDRGLSTLVHVSWNGATEVAFWNLYKTDAHGNDKKMILSVHRKGFETPIRYSGYAAHVVVEGVDLEGNKLGQSKVFETLNPAGLDPGLMHSEPSPSSSLDAIKAVDSDTIFAFLAGAIFCAAAGLTIWGVLASWRRYTRRTQTRYTALATVEDDGENDAFQDDAEKVVFEHDRDSEAFDMDEFPDAKRITREHDDDDSIHVGIQ